VSSLTKARQFVEDILANYAKHGFWLYIVEDKQTGEAVEINSFVKRDYLNTPDMGFAISESQWSNGYVYEFSLAIHEHAR